MTRGIAVTLKNRFVYTRFGSGFSPTHIAQMSLHCSVSRLVDFLTGAAFQAYL